MTEANKISAYIADLNTFTRQLAGIAIVASADINLKLFKNGADK